MPLLDGMTMVRRIRESDALRVSVIFLTGQTSPANVIAAPAMGAFAYLQKPIDLDVLESKVKRALWH